MRLKIKNKAIPSRSCLIFVVAYCNQITDLICKTAAQRSFRHKFTHSKCVCARADGF